MSDQVKSQKEKATPRVMAQQAHIKKPVGELLAADRLIMRVHAGTVTDENGNTFDMAHSISGCPMIENPRTNKKFLLSWEEIMEMAIEAGICDE